ncbi:alpha/beta hydrolase [Nocardioides sp. IC4_145]|uniref:alpha/beta hydrolase fold domain-containing protein n=1 Tax=Nocardioides sp. IC4_145 TaxID=2714037 RepID=UPI001409A2E9|nr:alpha/beta hydrolase [Nocardioides sp. IC4_145]
MPSLTHQALAWALPRLRKSRDLDSAGAGSLAAERARIEAWHRSTAGDPMPTNAVTRFERRFVVSREEVPAAGGSFPAYVLAARGATPSRTVVYVHGGGYTAGIDPFHVRYVARLADRLGVRVVLPDYPLAPEHTWRDSHDALVDLTASWVSRSPGGAVLAGDSAGGGLALALALSLRDRGLPQPDRLLLHAPWVDLSTSTPETEEYDAVDPWLFLGKLRAYAAWWAGSEADLTRPEVSPALGDLAGLPRALVFQGTRDLLTPGTRLLARRAAEAGWDLTYVEEPGLLHVYPLLPLVPEARRAWRRTEAFLR